MGVNGAFDEGGFENIVQNEPLKVSAVKHRATVEVTRDGTVGAAASAIEIVSFQANVSVCSTSKDLIFGIVTRVSARDFTVGIFQAESITLV